MCDNPYFWELKAIQELGISKEEFEDTNLDPKTRYIELIALKMNLKDLNKASLKDNLFRRVLDIPNFWLLKVYEDFGISDDQYYYE